MTQHTLFLGLSSVGGPQGIEVRFHKGGSLCSEHERTNVPYSHRKGSERRSSEIPRGQAGYQEASDVQEGWPQGIKMTPTAVRRFHGCESCSGLPIVMVTATSKASGRALEF